MIGILLFFLLIFPTFHLYAQDDFWDKPPHPNGSYGYDETLPDLLNIKGLAYHEARPAIISIGWRPLQTLYEGRENYKVDAMSGDGKIVWTKGYHELKSCTGGGPPYCAFLFQNKNGDQLRIVTKGEQWDNLSHSPKVVGYKLISKN